MERITGSVRGVSLLKVVVDLWTEPNDEPPFGVSSQIPGDIGQNGRTAGKSHGDAGAQSDPLAMLGG
jgi:hypothetical protein